MHKKLKDAMYSVSLYCLFAYTRKFNKYIHVNMTSLGRTLHSSSDLHLLAFSFYFLTKTILFLYNLGNQHSADLSFHVMCYRCCLQLPQFAAHVVWMNSVTFAMFHCTLYASCFQSIKFVFNVLATIERTYSSM